jgi:phage terminase large subunit GpA-like protein
MSTTHKPRTRSFTAPRYIVESLEALRPPDNVTVSEWAEQHRIMDARSTNLPGPWRNMVTPYLAGIMDEFNHWETEEVIFVKPTQVGGTEAIQNMLGYVIAQDPAPTLIVYPTDELAQSTSDNRIAPMIKASPALRRHFNRKGSTKTELQFDNMYISLSGSNSPSGLASKPIRYLFLDEVDKYPAASRQEADPISLARERTKTFVSNRKIYMCSTPTLRTGHIWKAKESADVEKHYFVPCPHCGKYIELKFAQIKWPEKSDDMSDADRAEFANYICQECGGVITDQNKPQMLRNGEWRNVRESTRFSRKVAFWINTLYSPFTRFSEIAKAFLVSKDDPDALHNFTNSWLAEPWEDTKLKTNADVVMDRQTDFDMFDVPPWAKMLTGGVDVQENCLYWTIRAWGDFLTSQNIAHGQAFSLNEVGSVMNLEYRKADGTVMLVDLVLIDSGDQTDEIYEFCAVNTDWALPCKGTQTMLSHYKLSTVNKAGSKAYGMNLVLVDGGKYKDMIAGRMRKPNGKGSWMVYKGVDLEYCEQVTAEHKIIERSANGKETPRWVLKSSHADNHYLDCEVYCMAAADVLGVRNLFLQAEVTPEQAAAAPPKPRNEPQVNAWLPQNTTDWI